MSDVEVYSDEYWMQHAFEQAALAASQGEIPVGAILVSRNQIIGSGYNAPISLNDPTAHAEMSAIRKAAQKLRTVDLTGAIIYASGEPCPMCQAALYMVGIREVHYLFSNADGESYQLSTKAIADEMMKLPQERSGMTFRQADPEMKARFIDIYQLWSTR